jgi:hypothetical protein
MTRFLFTFFVILAQARTQSGKRFDFAFGSTRP